MDRSDVCPGRLVRCKRKGPGFRKGALFQVLPTIEGIPVSPFIGCRAVGSALFKVWCFRARDLIAANQDDGRQEIWTS